MGLVDECREEEAAYFAEHGVYYPDVTVKLIGVDGNAFNIMGIVITALRKAGVSWEERDEFWTEATAGNYDQLLQTCMRWVNVT